MCGVRTQEPSKFSESWHMVLPFGDYEDHLGRGSGELSSSHGLLSLLSPLFPPHTMKNPRNFEFSSRMAEVWM